MPPFAKFRGHRRTSTPTSPNPNLIESPIQHSGQHERSSASSESPFDASFPSPRLHVPFTGATTASPTGFGGQDVTALPRFSGQDHYNSRPPAYFDQPPRPVSSSAAVAPFEHSPIPVSSFQGPSRFRSNQPSEQGFHHAHSMSMADRSLSQDDIGRGGGLSASSSERTLAEEYESPRMFSGKTGKGRLNLLNPMSLLARRRSSQAVSQVKEDPQITINTLPVPAMPEDYDPRIRGKIVHDFSAPRPRRGMSSDGPLQEPHAVSQRDPRHRFSSKQDEVRKNSKSPPEHAPHFKEDFSDDRPNLQPASTGYLHAFAASASVPHPDYEPPPVPAFARGLPTRLPEPDANVRTQRSSLPKPQSPPTKPPPVSPPIKSPPASPPANTRIVTGSPPGSGSKSIDATPQHAVPKHMKSNASRFSFDLNGVNSAAQEKLLEEKHKQKEALRASEFDPGDEDAEPVDDYTNYDFDDDFGYEEKIPEFNIDDEEMEDRAGVDVNLHQFHFSPAVPSAIMSPTTLESGRTSFPTPRDDHGHAIGFATTKESPYMNEQSPPYYQLQHQVEHTGPGLLDSMKGLGISSMPVDDISKGPPATGPVLDDDLDEDMYFDDGDIDLGGDEAGDAKFDESIFDDETGRIRDIPADNARNLEAAQARRSQTGVTLTDQRVGPIAQPSVENALGSVKQDLDASHQTGLTEGNMAAFQEALLTAANKAAARDQLFEESTNSGRSDDQVSTSHQEGSRPSLVPDDGRISQNTEAFGKVHFAEEYTFNDDEMDDDLLIAEANAEALENDDEGFYGREFGFYAKANPKADAEMINGGYFVPRGTEGVHRSHSGKANFQEPSLTPITERSEWSARNSMASMHAFGIPQSANSLPSPAIADLIGQGNFDDDMSLSTLLKLRRGAWGGSQTSLHSSASQASNSPHTHTSPRDHMNQPFPMDPYVNMSNSAYSLTGSAGIVESEEEDEDEFNLSPTVTQNTPRKAPATVQPATPFTSMPNPPFYKSESGHSRNSSGADSVSYIKDQDGRFIVERKRTLDSGEIELLGRELLVGTI